MSGREERADARRRTWTGGVAHSFDEAELLDLEFWMAATPAERVAGVTQLLGEMPWPEADGGATDRLQRSVGGVRPRRG